MKRLVIAAISVAMASTGGCTVIGGESGTYRLTAYFAKTPSLYERSRVKVMGADVGSITSIRADGGRVRVEFNVNRDVSLPTDVHAAVASANPLGERNITLFPLWKPGAPKASPGAVIPQERTEVAVEVDDALAAFTKLTESLDPAKVRNIVKSGAGAVDGHGRDINAGLQSTATLTQNLASQDDKLIKVARGLQTLAARLNKRDTQLGAMISAFSSTSHTLAGERTQLRDFLAGVAGLIRNGDVLITAYQETLPSTLAKSSEVFMTFKANSASVGQSLYAIAKFLDAAAAAWDRKNHMIIARFALTPTLRAWLQPLFTAMGWGRVPCPPKPLGNCPGQQGGRR